MKWVLAKYFSDTYLVFNFVSLENLHSTVIRNIDFIYVAANRNKHEMFHCKVIPRLSSVIKLYFCSLICCRTPETYFNEWRQFHFPVKQYISIFASINYAEHMYFVIWTETIFFGSFELKLNIKISIFIRSFYSLIKSVIL